jgi:hypothetical protein
MCTSGDLFVTSKIKTISTMPYFQVFTQSSQAAGDKT